MARNKVHRNVVALCTVPVGQAGRPSKSLTLPQAEALLAAAEDTPLHYLVRLLAYGLILWAILEKNLPARRRDPK